MVRGTTDWFQIGKGLPATWSVPSQLRDQLLLSYKEERTGLLRVGHDLATKTTTLLHTTWRNLRNITWVKDPRNKTVPNWSFNLYEVLKQGKLIYGNKNKNNTGIVFSSESGVGVENAPEVSMGGLPGIMILFYILIGVWIKRCLLLGRKVIKRLTDFDHAAL